MNISTYGCLAPPRFDAHLNDGCVTLGAPGTTDALKVSGTRGERIALLTAWAEVEGCEVIVGPEREAVAMSGAAAYYGGRSGARTGD